MNKQMDRLVKSVSIGFILCLLSSVSRAELASQWRHPESGMQFVRIDAGCFMMGAERAWTGRLDRIPEGPRPDELPRHRVCVDSFWLATHEVTRTQWQQIRGMALPVAEGDLPVTDISLAQAEAFVQRLNQSGEAGYRLPTEAEWEYACRAGSDDSATDLASPEHVAYLRTIARFLDPAPFDPSIFPVGSMPANDWGLYDMLGNAWELTGDDYQPEGYRLHAPSNPFVDQGGERQVIRGGSFRSDRFQVRCGARSFALAEDPLPTVGLRIAISIPTESE